MKRTKYFHNFILSYKNNAKTIETDTEIETFKKTSTNINPKRLIISKKISIILPFDKQIT